MFGLYYYTHVVATVDGQKFVDAIDKLPEDLRHLCEINIAYVRDKQGAPVRKVLAYVHLYPQLHTLEVGKHTLIIPDWIQGFGPVKIKLSEECVSCGMIDGRVEEFRVLSSDEKKEFVLEVLEQERHYDDWRQPVG